MTPRQLVVVPLTVDMWLALRRSIVGTGGVQQLLRALQPCMVDTGQRLELRVYAPSALVDRTVRYFDQGDGGWQRRLRPLATALKPYATRRPVQGRLFAPDDDSGDES